MTWGLWMKKRERQKTGGKKGERDGLWGRKRSWIQRKTKQKREMGKICKTVRAFCGLKSSRWCSYYINAVMGVIMNSLGTFTGLYFPACAILERCIHNMQFIIQSVTDLAVCCPGARQALWDTPSNTLLSHNGTAAHWDTPAGPEQAPITLV